MTGTGNEGLPLRTIFEGDHGLYLRGLERGTVYLYGTILRFLGCNPLLYGMVEQ